MIYCFSSTFACFIFKYQHRKRGKEKKNERTRKRTNKYIIKNSIMRNCNCIELRKKKGHPDYNIIKPTNYNNKIYLIYMEQEIRGNSLYIYIIYVIFYACTLIRTSYQ
jgi:hypothetical protein